MRTLAITEVCIEDLKHSSRASPRYFVRGEIRIVEWHKEDPFPELGPSVGVDTETELITETNSAPPLVVLGVFDHQSRTCYISYWEDAAVFIRELSKREIQQRYFNLGFDEHVLNDVDPELTLLQAIECGRVRDMQIRLQLYDIATLGFIPYNHYSLADCAKLKLGIQLDKGEKDDPNSHRLTFRRGTPITQEQAVYLMWDCLSTWCLGERIVEQPTEVQHSKGMCVLAHISHNGFPVDMRVFDAFESKLQEQKDEYRDKLLTFGFPDPYKKSKDENGDYKRFVAEQTQKFIDATTKTIELVDGITSSRVTGPLNLCKGNMRMALVYMYNFANDPDFKYDFEDNVAFWLVQEKPKNLRKNEKPVYAEMVQEYDLLKFFDAGKEIVMNALFGHIMEDLNKQREAGAAAYDLKHAVEYASDIIDANPHWLSDEKPVGPKTFLQEHISNLLARNPTLELEKTEKSGDYKLTLKDMWRLEDAGVKDPFMETYTTFKHSEKYLSTYLNRENVKEDGKIHARFTNLMKTGRTSCTRPNLQNLPSRDKKYPLKNMFCAPEGAILCATDFSFY